jgi:hypothetical protein
MKIALGVKRARVKENLFFFVLEDVELLVNGQVDLHVKSHSSNFEFVKETG